MPLSASDKLPNSGKNFYMIRSFIGSLNKKTGSQTFKDVVRLDSFCFFALPSRASVSAKADSPEDLRMLPVATEVMCFILQHSHLAGKRMQLVMASS